MREGDPRGWSLVLITALGSWEKPVPCGHRKQTKEGDPKGWSTVLITPLGRWDTYRVEQFSLGRPIKVDRTTSLISFTATN
jgi:hypothetical protein